MKFTSIFYKARAGYIRALAQIHKQTSGKYEVYFNILQSEGNRCSLFTANNINSQLNEQSLKK